MTMRERLKKIEVARDMKRQGRKVADIAKELNLSRGTVYNWLKAKPVRAKRANPPKAAATRKAS